MYEGKYYVQKLVDMEHNKVISKEGGGYIDLYQNDSKRVSNFNFGLVMKDGSAYFDRDGNPITKEQADSILDLASQDNGYRNLDSYLLLY